MVLLKSKAFLKSSWFKRSGFGSARLAKRDTGKLLENQLKDLFQDQLRDNKIKAGAIGLGTWITKAQFRDVKVSSLEGQSLYEVNLINVIIA